MLAVVVVVCQLIKQTDESTMLLESNINNFSTPMPMLAIVLDFHLGNELIRCRHIINLPSTFHCAPFLKRNNLQAKTDDVHNEKRFFNFFLRVFIFIFAQSTEGNVQYEWNALFQRSQLAHKSHTRCNECKAISYPSKQRSFINRDSETNKLVIRVSAWNFYVPRIQLNVACGTNVDENIWICKTNRRLNDPQCNIVSLGWS